MDQIIDPNKAVLLGFIALWLLVVFLRWLSNRSKGDTTLVELLGSITKKLLKVYNRQGVSGLISLDSVLRVGTERGEIQRPRIENGVFYFSIVSEGLPQDLEVITVPQLRGRDQGINSLANRAIKKGPTSDPISGFFTLAFMKLGDVQAWVLVDFKQDIRWF